MKERNLYRFLSDFYEHSSMDTSLVESSDKIAVEFKKGFSPA